MQQKTKILSGFSLLQLSIVLVIIALISASAIVAGQAMKESANISSTNNRLDTIEKALMAYRAVNNRMPCPADLQATTGAENGAPGTCTSGSAGTSYFTANTPSIVNTLDPAADNKMIEGAVPAAALNLPNEYMYDGWGRKIAYSVWLGVTNVSGAKNYGVVNSCKAMTVKTASVGNVRTDSAYYALVSFGPNGHGAFNSAGTRISSGSSDPDEQYNCHCNGSAVDTGYAGTYVQKETTTGFDDIVRFKERWQMMASEDTHFPGGNLTCNPGFKIKGSVANSSAGRKVLIADINGDGIPDMIIGAPDMTGGVGAGTVYVVFGTKNGFADPLLLSGLDGTNGFRLDGVTVDSKTGFSLAAGDVNGDGINDIIIGAPGLGNGYVYVVYGKKSSWAATQNLTVGGTVINGTNGFVLTGEAIANYYFGEMVAVGDVNGDGIADMVIGSFTNGKTYVVYGTSSARAQSVTAASLVDGMHGYAITHNGLGPVDNGSFAVGDVNGDGIADIVLGMWTASSHSFTSNGSVFVIFGQKRPVNSQFPATFNITQLNGTNGFRLDGANNTADMGGSVALGDVNGDGINDIIIGAYGLSGKGGVYVVYGHSAQWAADTMLSTANLNMSNAIRIDGGAGNLSLGWSVAAADLNGDGIADMIMQDYQATPNGAMSGQIYVLFGTNNTLMKDGLTSWAATQTIDTAGTILNGTNGFTLNGATNDWAGMSLATGDINNDGISDLLIGSGASAPGLAYGYFGQRQNSAWSTPYNLSNLCTGGSC